MGEIRFDSLTLNKFEVHKLILRSIKSVSRQPICRHQTASNDGMMFNKSNSEVEVEAIKADA